MQEQDVVVGKKYRIIQADPFFAGLIGTIGLCSGHGVSGLFQIVIPSGGALYFTAAQLEEFK